MKIIIAFIFLINFNALSQPVIEWQRCYGGTSGEDALDMKKTSDGGYIFSGGTLSNNGNVSGNHGDADMWLVKTDSMGFIQWQKCFGGTGFEDAESVIQTSTGGYLACGTTGSDDGDVSGNHGSGDFWVIMMDNSGNLQWQKCFGGSNTDEAFAATETDDGCYLVAGYTESYDGDVTGIHDTTTNNRADMWLLKIDSLGNLLWQKCLGGTWPEKAYSVLTTNDGKYAIAGQASSHDGDVSGVHGNTHDYWLVKMDTSGMIVWQKSYGGFMNSQFCFAMEELSDGGFLLGGYSMFDTTGDLTSFHGTPGSGSDMWVIRTDSLGNLLQQKCLGGTYNENAYSLKQTVDGGFIASGYSMSNDGDVSGNHGYDIWIIKLDTFFNLQWQKCLGGSGSDEARSIIQTIDGGFIVSGGVSSIDGDVIGSHGGGDLWVVKLSPDPLGISKPANPITDFTAYNNSASQSLFLSFYANGNEKTQVHLFDITGREILHQPLAVTAGFNKQRVYTGDLSGGIYFVRLLTEGGAVTKKVVFQ